MAGLGLELAILRSAVRLTVDCAREPGLQKCGLFLRPVGKIWMYFLNVSYLMTKLTKWCLRPAKTQISPGVCPVCSVFALRRLGGCPGWPESRPVCWFCHEAAHVYTATESPSVESESDCESRGRWFDSSPATYVSLRLIMRIHSKKYLVIVTR